MNAFTRFLALPLCALSALTASAAAASFYPQPNPSGDEQYLLERINVARANPTAEGAMLAGSTDSEISRYYSYYGVDRNALRRDFASYAAKPPLAMNAKLMVSAHQQSADQATHGFQGHDSSDGTSFDERITRTGYGWSALGENVFAYVENPLFGHVGLNADWGVPSLDHRANIMNTQSGFPTFKEVGISYVASNLPNFGPYVMSADFGTPANGTDSFLVGVVYNDVNGNGSYDSGEGLSGVSITTDAGDFYTTTASAGGYVLPLPAGNGSLTITASGASLGAPRVQTISYANNNNVKADFTLKSASGPILPVVKIKVSSKTLALGDAPSLITISRSGDSSKALQVALGVSGTAIPGVDCNALPTSVMIPAGTAAVTVPVQAQAPAAEAPTAVLPTKKVKLRLQQGAGYLVSNDIHLAKTHVKIWNQN